MLVHPFVPAYLLLEQKKEEQKLILLWLQDSKLHLYYTQNSPSSVIQSQSPLAHLMPTPPSLPPLPFASGT